MYDELISRWARERPNSTAVILPRRQVSYAEFDGQINRFAHRLAALGLPPQAKVAIHIGDEYIHSLAMLALDRLGLPSISVATASPQHPVLNVLQPDLLLTNFTNEPRLPMRVVQIDQAWFDEAMKMPSTRPERLGSPDEIVRFLGSSGTTGIPKAMGLARSTVTARVDTASAGLSISAASRGCVLVGQDTGAGYIWSLCFWAAGGSAALNMKFAGPVEQAARRTNPTHLFVAVGTLLTLVQGPAADLPPLPPATQIIVSGSALPGALAEEARRVLGPNIVVGYGASEAGLLAVATPALLRQHEGTVGKVLPSAEVQAVDEAGGVLPPGTPGILRARGNGMVKGYLNEGAGGAPAADAGLRNGWFYPGDLGSVSADGLVILHGRASDIINIGGNKFAPQAIEEVALSCAGIRDAAAFSVLDRSGVERPWIAVVRDHGHKSGELAGKLKARWPALHSMQIVATPEVPRNRMGKIDRLKLRQQGQAWLASEAARQAAGPRT